jgi:DNA-binding IclR family transcriptional regulator
MTPHQEFNMPRGSAKRMRSSPRTFDQGASVRTVLVAARVLDALANFRGPVRLVDLARVLKMTLPRMSRHIATLRSLGYVEKTEPGDTYRLGTKLFLLGQIALEQNALVHVAQTHMMHLRDETGHTVLLSTHAKDGATVLLCVPSQNAANITVRPGTVLELPASPTARVMHAFALSPGQSSACSVPERHLNFVLAHYYDFEADVRQTGIGSIAAPVFDHAGHIAGVLAVVIPSTALLHGADPMTIKAVMDYAARISATMGSTTWSQRNAPQLTGRKTQLRRQK